jgi:hypothetical protein
VLVHDAARLENEKLIDLRWHTITPPSIQGGNSFFVRYKNAALSAKIVGLHREKISLSTGRQEYKAPYHLTRQGDPLVQDYEPFVKISTKTNSYSLLTLFSVIENKEELPLWLETEKGWTIEVNGVEYVIEKRGRGFRVFDKNRPDKGIFME